MRFLDSERMYALDILSFVLYGIGPNKARKKEKEIRDYIAAAEYLDAAPILKQKLAADKSIDEILDYLEACSQVVDARFEEKEAEINKILGALDPTLVNYPLDYGSIRLIRNTTDAYLELPGVQGISSKLIFRNANLEKGIDIEGTWWYELYRTENGFCLEFFNYAHETVKVECTDLAFERKFYKATDVLNFPENPWEHLAHIAEVIREKARTDKSLLNEKELALLPALEAVWAIIYHDPFEIKEADFSAFAALASEYGLEKIERMLAKRSTLKSDRQKKRFYDQLLRMLNKAACEPLWRRLYNDICDSQKDIPSIVSTIHPNKVAAARKKVTAILHGMGFSGEYPEFYMDIDKRKIALISAYGQEYFVINEKHPRAVVRALETVIDDEFQIHFISGTVFLNKQAVQDGVQPDAFYAMFDDGGKRTFRLTQALIGNLMPELAAEIAGKRAKLQRLSKQERELVGTSSLGAIWLLALLMGLFFGISFTIVFGLFAMLMLLLDGMLQSFWDFPWLLCFVFCTVAFGGSMGIIMTLQQRK